MSVRSFKQVEDKSGCKHEFLVGPQQRINKLLVGYCDSCKREVAVEMNDKDERTGRSRLIEYTDPGTTSANHH